MRGQEGTPDLRALAYMDEVFGYVPPTAAPPAKKPILTIFKQGRAFGLGLVLSTQNPVDLDYKAMSNAGTWLVGRLQTENDKARVLEGLRSAAGGTDVAALDKAIGGAPEAAVPARLGEGVAAAALRDALGDVVPLRAADEGAGRSALEQAPPVQREAGCGSAGARRTPRRRPSSLPTRPSVAPPVAPGTPVSYLDPAAPWAAAVGATRGSTRLRAVPRGSRVAPLRRQRGRRRRAAGVRGGLRPARRRPRPRERDRVDYDDRDFSTEAPVGRRLRPPAGAPSARSASSRRRRKEIQQHLVDRRPLELQRNRALKLVSRPGETAEELRGALRRRRAAAGRRGGGEDPRPARGEAGPAREGARAGAATRRGARHRHAVTHRPPS